MRTETVIVRENLSQDIFKEHLEHWKLYHLWMCRYNKMCVCLFNAIVISLSVTKWGFLAVAVGSASLQYHTTGGIFYDKWYKFTSYNCLKLTYQEAVQISSVTTIMETHTLLHLWSFVLHSAIWIKRQI